MVEKKHVKRYEISVSLSHFEKGYFFVISEVKKQMSLSKFKLLFG